MSIQKFWAQEIGFSKNGFTRVNSHVSQWFLTFSSVRSLGRVRLFVTPWISACQASLSITISQSSLKLTSIELVMPSSHLILCRPLLLLPPIPPSIRVLSNESTLRMRWPKYWSFSFSIIHSKEHPGLISLLCIHKVWILASKFGFHWSTREHFWNYLMHINKHIVDGESQYSPSQGKE